MRDNKNRSAGVKETPKTAAGIRSVIVPKQFNWLYDWFMRRKGEGFIFIGIYNKFTEEKT